MNISICDDNREYISVVESYLEKLDISPIEHDVFTSGEELVKIYESEKAIYDVIFLDMEMDGINGIETAKRIREFDKHVQIVFVTSYEKYVYDSFECSPFRFLVKPVNFDKFKQVFDDVCKKLSEEIKFFCFTENKSKIRLFCNDIIYFESQNHFTLVHTKNKSYKICKSLSDVHNMVDKDKFCRIHKSFVINLFHVEKLGKKEVLLDCLKKNIPISRTYQKIVPKEYTKFVERNLFL